MLITGIILMIIAIFGIRSVWSKNEWRMPVFEVEAVLNRRTNPKMAEIISGAKRRTIIGVSILFLLYLIGATLIYFQYSHLWVLILAMLVALWLLKAVVGLFKAGYSRKVRLLNYLYSPYILAWRRDHWSGYSEEQIAVAICNAVGIDTTTIEMDEMSLDNFLLALCRKTRPQNKFDKYPNILRELHEQSKGMVWTA